MSSGKIEAALRSGLSFLVARQAPDGLFPSRFTEHCHGDRSDEDWALFPTLQILHSLEGFLFPQAQAISELGVRAVLSEMDSGGRWRFWARRTFKNGVSLHAYARADLDDMACAASLLRKRGVPFPDNSPLMLHNRDRRGLFYTWLGCRRAFLLRPSHWRSLLGEVSLLRSVVFWKKSEAAPDDVDGVVNANVLYCLGAREETRPVIDWLMEITRSGAEETCDKWYRERFSFYYAVSRNYRAGILPLGQMIPTALDRLSGKAHPDGSFGQSVLHTALAACTLLNFCQYSPLLEKSIAFLLASQKHDGAWAAAPHFYGGPQKTVSWGGRELTTGFCLEAIHRFHCEGMRSRSN